VSLGTKQGAGECVDGHIKQVVKVKGIVKAFKVLYCIRIALLANEGDKSVAACLTSVAKA